MSTINVLALPKNTLFQDLPSADISKIKGGGGGAKVELSFTIKVTINKKKQKSTTSNGALSYA